MTLLTRFGRSGRNACRPAEKAYGDPTGARAGLLLKRVGSWCGSLSWSTSARTRGLHAGIGLAGSSFKAHTEHDTQVGAGIVARLAYGVTPRLVPYLEGEAVRLAMAGGILSHVDAGRRIHLDPMPTLPAPYIDVSLAATEVSHEPGRSSGMNSVSIGGGVLLPIFALLVPDLGVKLAFGSCAWLDSVRVRIGALRSSRGRP